MLQLTEKLWNRKILALALLLVSLSQFAVVTHELLVEHSVGEHCEICVAQDRLDDYIVSATALPLVFAVAAGLLVVANPSVQGPAPAAVSIRGPPLL